jgi:hypothetical protein
MKIIPDGNFFGNNEEDEFKVNIKGKDKGVFKRLEYLSIPFSITNNEDKLEDLYENARFNESLDKEIEADPEAKELVENIFNRMSNNPQFSKQALDMRLPLIYLKDKAITNLELEDNLIDNISRIALAWKEQKDFYCIEGLVGGDGEGNPFEINGKLYSPIAGGLDCLETELGSIFEKIDDETKTKTALQISSLINREYTQIFDAINVLGMVHGKEKDLSKEEISSSLEILDDLTKTGLDKNVEFGKFYNTVIRFHNWMPNPLKEGDKGGDTYDSICTPTKRSLEILKEQSGYESVIADIEQIQDATSPKGLALVSLVDEGVIAGKEHVLSGLAEKEKEIQYGIEKDLERFDTIGLQDKLFYPGLVGGKWKGLKLLHDTQEAFDLDYKVPEGFVITTPAVSKYLTEIGLEEYLDRSMFNITEGDKKTIRETIEKNKFLDKNPAIKEKINNMSEDLVVRSSMYGEDGESNFSGTYESEACSNKEDEINHAINTVIDSYFGDEAIKCREDIGLAHAPGINVIVQDRVSGKGGVVFVTSQGCSLTYAVNPEEAVNGNGSHEEKDSLDELIGNDKYLNHAKDDLEKIYSVFGDSDIEFVIGEDSQVYLTQLRPKYVNPEVISREDLDLLPEVKVSTVEDLEHVSLDQECLVYMKFLGKDNVMNKEGEIMDFIRSNKDYVKGIAGTMPKVAHIPNKIEGHFKIPYLKKEE